MWYVKNSILQIAWEEMYISPNDKQNHTQAPTKIPYNKPPSQHETEIKDSKYFDQCNKINIDEKLFQK